MTTFLARINAIMGDLDERIKRERKATELKEMTDKLALVNEELGNIIWAYYFVKGISGNSDLGSLFENLCESYRGLRQSFVDLWGETPTKIDILEPSEFYEPLDEILEICEKLEAGAQAIVRGVLDKVKAARTLANSLSIIPDIKVNFQVFREAENFLSNASLSAKSMADFVKRDEEICGNRIQEWNVLSQKITKEQEKLDIKSFKGRKLSDPTIDFLNQLVKNNGKADFESLSGEVVDELKIEFPELSKRLRLSIY